MRSLTQLRYERTERDMLSVRRLRGLHGTLAHQRLVDRAQRCIELWLSRCLRPAVAVSGGKDSTALLQLVRQVDPTVPAYRADMPPPVPLSDRAAHVEMLAQAAGGSWRIVPYWYDVEGVLAGRSPYPYGLKVREMRARMRQDGVDGIALGLRGAESRGRAWNLRVRGELYMSGGRLVCTPLAEWSALEVLALIVGADRLPLNPCYERQYLMPDGLEHLRDGTWMPNQMSEARGYRAWLAHHYPEHVRDYDRAVVALRGGRVR